MIATMRDSIGAAALAIAGFANLACSAHAQTRTESDDPKPIVVTASRTGKDGAASTATISAETIARLQPPTLLDALNDVAGVRAVSTNGVGGGSFVAIRGGEPNFTLVLLDGIRVNNATNSQGGAFDFTLLDPALVAAVEVERGPASAVHGSDALAGVINIRLRDPRRDATDVTGRITAGSDSARGGGVTLAHGWNSGGLLLGGAAYDSGASDAGSDVQRGQGIARLRQRIGGYDATLLALYATNDHRAFPQDSGGPRLAVIRAKDAGSGSLWTLGAAVRRSPEAAVRPNLSLSWSQQTDQAATPAIAPGILSAVPAITVRNRLSRLEAIADVTATRGPLTATAGAALLDEQGSSTGTIDFGFRVPTDFRIDRRTLSGFAEATLRPGAGFTLNAAARFDSVRGGPHVWTERGGVAWQPGAHLPTVFVRYGTGFKLPSFYALGNPLIGRPDLRPERSRDWEAGTEWTRPQYRLHLAYFDNRFRDLIDFDPLRFALVNRDRVAITGVEGEATLRAGSSIDVSGALTWLRIDSPTPLRNRPDWQGNVRLVWRPLHRVELNGAVRFNGDYADSSVPTGLVVTRGRAQADIGARWTGDGGVGVSAVLRNLADSRAETAVGFPELGRRLLVTLVIGGR